VCKAFYENGKKIPENVQSEIKRGMAYVEKKSGKKLGDPVDPLLVSVRY